MTKEEIIIDNVDVSRCNYLALNRVKLTNDASILKIPHYCDMDFIQCESNNCYYKQLQNAKHTNNQLIEENVFLNQTLKACEEEHRKLTKKYNELVNQL